MALGRTAVTGGAGFVGRHLVRGLQHEGPVTVLDLRKGPGMEGDVTYRVGDVTRPGDVEEAVRGAEVVFHLAALVSVPDSVRDPEAFTQTNVHGTLNVLRAARAAGVRRVVFASSCAVYGARTPPLREDVELDPLSPYASTKIAGELWCRLHHELRPETVALRLFNVYGPGQSPGGPYAAVIPTFLDAALGARPVTIHGDGGQTRDFVFVGDVVDALVRGATAEGVSGEAINVGTGVPVSVNRLLEVVNDVLGTRVEATHGPPREGDIRESYGDVAKAERILGFRARVDLAQGLLATAESLRASRKA